MKNKLILIPAVLLITAILLSACGISTETPGILQPTQSSAYLNVNRIIGYSSGGAEIKGKFRMAVIGVENIQSATFLIDGEPVATIDTGPFEISFRTEDYPFGAHDLSVTVHTADGGVMDLPMRHFVFVSAEEEQQAVEKILVPLLSGVAVVVAIGVGLQMLSLKKKQIDVPLGSARTYGFFGGGICPRCKRPFSLHIWGLNMLTGKLDRCDFCGKWSIQR
ncbi:hypothetical protein EG834_16985, partial [bacterium]|nr:hypothetical protein [bacterium]